jgi:hypothetical protein
LWEDLFQVAHSALNTTLIFLFVTAAGFELAQRREVLKSMVLQFYIMVQALGNERECEKMAVFHCDPFLLKVKEVNIDIRSNALPQASFPL